MSAAKAVLRDTLRRSRAALPPPYRDAATARVNDHLMRHPAVYAGPRVGGYAATSVEVDIDRVLSVTIARHGVVFLPRIVTGQIEFAPCAALTELRVGYAGIREPVTDAIDPATIDVLLIPGVGFDSHGRRLGHGAGHYDRVLEHVGASCVTIGVAFDVQIVPIVPTEPHDRAVRFVQTETTLIAASRDW